MRSGLQRTLSVSLESESHRLAPWSQLGHHLSGQAGWHCFSASNSWAVGAWLCLLLESDMFCCPHFVWDSSAEILTSSGRLWTSANDETALKTAGVLGAAVALSADHEKYCERSGLQEQLMDLHRRCVSRPHRLQRLRLARQLVDVALDGCRLCWCFLESAFGFWWCAVSCWLLSFGSLEQQSSRRRFARSGLWLLL